MIDSTVCIVIWRRVSINGKGGGSEVIYNFTTVPIINLNFATATMPNGPKLYSVKTGGRLTSWRVFTNTHEGQENDDTEPVTLLQIFNHFNLGWLLQCVCNGFGWLSVGTVS